MLKIANAMVNEAIELGIMINDTINIDAIASRQFLISAGFNSIYCK